LLGFCQPNKKPPRRARHRAVPGGDQVTGYYLEGEIHSKGSAAIVTPMLGMTPDEIALILTLCTDSIVTDTSIANFALKSLTWIPKA
jgi:hypothetical protein